MSRILKKIGRIKTPFSHEITASYGAAVVEIVRDHLGEVAASGLLEQVVCDHLEPGISAAMLDQHISKPHAWIDAALYMVFLELGKLYLKDSSLPRKLGPKVIKPTKFQMEAARFFYLKTIYRMVGTINSNFNNALVMKVEDSKRWQPAVVICRRSKTAYREKVWDIVNDEVLFRNWLANDCEITKGVLESVPLLFEKAAAEIKNEPNCEGRGDSHCLYYLRWEEETWANRLKGLCKRVVTLDYHRELKKQVQVMEATIKERVASLEAAQKELEMANKQLSSMSERLIQAEKRLLEQHIMSGFAHEMRNSLTGAQLELKRMADYKQSGCAITTYITDHLASLFNSIDNLKKEYGLPTDKVAFAVVDHVEAIYAAAQELHHRLEGIMSDVERGLEITGQVAS